MSRIFIHMSATGIRRGNGGFVMLAQFAQELSRMGYKIGVFDYDDCLHLDHFNWLSLGEVLFDIVPMSYIEGDVTAKIVTCWISVLLDKDRRKKPGIDGKIYYWDHGELLRHEHEATRHWIFDRCDKIAINNRRLEPLYRESGYNGEVFHLDNWIRRDLFYYDKDEKEPRTVGYQRDNFVYSIWDQLKSFRRILCEGDQASVAKKMRRSDLFVFWNRRKPSLVKGETFGMTLYEAMACGCVPVARRHGGNEHLEEIISMETRLDYVPAAIDLVLDSGRKEEMRNCCLDVIEREYRWDKRRQTVVRRFLR